jgi:glutamate synthase domain-containing protein 3
VVTNQDRNIGTRISGMLARKFQGENTGNTQFVTLDLIGIAGESLGAYLRTGVDINLIGAANDYVGKGLSGGTIRIRPEAESRMAENPQDHTIIGNTCFYGAIDGDLYAAGKAGNRFGVRLSGARAVIEGAQDSACEYMTGGEAVILGKVGSNFGAGASGGEAFVYDPDLGNKSSKDTFAKVTNLQACSPEAERLRERIMTHHGYTGSKQAERILKDWENAITNFRYVNFKTQANDKTSAAAAAPALINA